jgi:hypothetical protein
MAQLAAGRRTDQERLGFAPDSNSALRRFIFIEAFRQDAELIGDRLG